MMRKLIGPSRAPRFLWPNVRRKFFRSDGGPRSKFDARVKKDQARRVRGPLAATGEV